MRKLLALLSLLWLSGALAVSYVVKIEGEIDLPLATYVENAFAEAEAAGASGLVLWVDTPGGRIDAAMKISDVVLESPLPTLAVVKNAFSAGALISLSAEQIAMLPGSEIGAALPINVSPVSEPTAADRKFISAFKAKFRAVAEARGRPVELAEAMVDPEIEIEGLVAKGEPLTLTAAKAVELGVADFECVSLSEALEKAGFDGQTETLEIPTRIKVSRVLTNMYVAPVLLALGLLGLVVEFFTPGFGVPGLLGLIMLGLYFAGGLMAGMSGIVEVSLFLAGIALLLAEMFLIPGFGVAGIGGLAALAASIYLTFGNQAILVGSLAVIIGAVGLFLVLRYLPRTRAAHALVLNNAIDAQAPPRERLSALVGAVGRAISDLRPAGVARFGELKVDVVTDGEYIPKGSFVRVIKVEGARVVVRREEE
ncbi:NfeD family protein [Oceanithermus sp.]